jgi:hypothetical protein
MSVHHLRPPHFVLDVMITASDARCAECKERLTQRQVVSMRRMRSGSSLSQPWCVPCAMYEMERYYDQRHQQSKP